MAEKRFLLVGNSTYTNLGSEAIVRGTVNILNKTFESPKFVSIDTLKYPYRKMEETDRSIEHKSLYYPKPDSFNKFLFQTSKALLTREIAYKRYVRQISQDMQETDAVMFLGGDNFAGKPYYHFACSHQALRLKKVTVIWGASIGPFGGSSLYRHRVFEHLKKLNGIFVRETTTQNYLAENGISENVYLVEDPAFVMEPEEPKSNEFIDHFPKGAIGVSLSNLFLSRTRFHNNCKTGVYEIVEAIRRRSGRPIVLIGHCLSDGNSNDHKLLNSVLEEHASQWNDVFCCPEFMPSAQIKWVISRLHCLVAARTHATIAAFSSCVPTVSLVYSFKGVGINNRLFGGPSYVVTKENCSVETIIEKLDLVLADYDKIRKTLEEKMPIVKNGSMQAGEYLKNIMLNAGL